MTVITAFDALGARVGLTVNSFGSVSLEPPLAQWNLRINSALHRHFVEADSFSVSVLAADQQALATQFSSRALDRFAGVKLTSTAHWAPFIHGAIAHFGCKKGRVIRMGDHDLFIGTVQHTQTFPGAPLLFFRSQFGLKPS